MDISVAYFDRRVPKVSSRVTLATSGTGVVCHIMYQFSEGYDTWINKYFRNKKGLNWMILKKKKVGCKRKIVLKIVEVLKNTLKKPLNIFFHLRT